MELSAHSHLVLLAFIKLVAFGSVIFVITKISKNHCFSESMKYYKAYFFLAFILSFLNVFSELFNMKKVFEVQLMLYFIVSCILLLAIDEKYRNKLSMTILSMLLFALLLALLSFQPTFIQTLSIHAIGSIFLYSLMAISAIKKGKQLNNLGFFIMSFAFVLLVILSMIEIKYLYENDATMAYTAAISGANSAFIVLIIGFLTKIMLSEYNTLNVIALTDPLTGLNNRRGLYHLLESKIPSSNRDNTCCSVITMDLDFFKKTNDTHGHDGGDIVLKEFSKMIKSTHRNTDIAARLGGEEFILVLPDTDKQTALIIAEKLRAHTEVLPIDIKGNVINITSSFGIDTSCDGLNMDELFKNADKALYVSKFSGRNRVTHFKDT